MAVVAAVVCATAGTAAPLCAAGTVLVGAVKGAAIGAVVGAAQASLLSSEAFLSLGGFFIVDHL